MTLLAPKLTIVEMVSFHLECFINSTNQQGLSKLNSIVKDALTSRYRIRPPSDFQNSPLKKGDFRYY